MGSTDARATASVERTIEQMQAALPIAWAGRQYGAADGWRSLLLAACKESSLSLETRSTRHAPHANTVWEMLRAQGWWTLTAVERGLNECLRCAAKHLGKGPLSLAIDLHDQPYYGNKDGAMVRGGQRKDGTNYFFTYATAYVIRQQRRYTLALVEVAPGETMAQILARVLALLAPLDLWIGVVLLDRGFFAADVIALLQARDLPFIIPVKQTGDIERMNGTVPLFGAAKSGWTRWQLTGADGNVVTFDVAIKVEHSDEGNVAIPFACGGQDHRSPRAIAEEYRLRFGIESSYRQAYQVRIMTTTPDPVYRLLRFGLAMLLRNQWIMLRRALGEPRTGRGGVRLHKQFLVLPQFLDALAHAIHADWPRRPIESFQEWRQRTPSRRRGFRIKRQRQVA